MISMKRLVENIIDQQSTIDLNYMSDREIDLASGLRNETATLRCTGTTHVNAHT